MLIVVRRHGTTPSHSPPLVATICRPGSIQSLRNQIDLIPRKASRVTSVELDLVNPLRIKWSVSRDVSILWKIDYCSKFLPNVFGHPEDAYTIANLQLHRR